MENSVQIQASSSQNFGFSYTTTSGKSLSLSMFDNQSVSYSKENNAQSISLKREYGFHFTYEGSKLTQDDISEIKDAMKDVEPLLNDFLQSSKVGELNPKDFIQSAMQIANILPSSSDENKQNATMNSLVGKFDELLKRHQSQDATQNANMLEDSKKLIDEILARIEEQKRELLQNTQDKQNKNALGFYA